MKIGKSGIIFNPNINIIFRAISLALIFSFISIKTNLQAQLI